MIVRLKKKNIGRFTLYEGTRGNWNRLSYPVTGEDMKLLLERKIDTATYVKRLRENTKDMHRACALQGKPARGLISSLLMRAKLKMGATLVDAEQ